MSRKPTAPPFICSHTFRYKTGTSGESLCVLLKVNSGVFLGISLTCCNRLPLSCNQWNWKEKTDLDEQLDARLLVRVLPKCHLVPKKSLIHFFFFKVPLRQSSVALHTHPQTNQQICRKRADFKVLLWFSGGCAVVDVSRERVRHLAGLPGFCQRAPGRLSLWAHFYKSGERGRIQRRWAGCSLFYTRSQTQWGESLK